MVPNIISGGIGSYEQGNRSLSKQCAVKATNIFGGHQVKYGVEYRRRDYARSSTSAPARRSWRRTAGRRRPARDRHHPADVALRARSIGVTRANFNDRARHAAELRRTSSLQDTWRVGDRLTINPGIRYEQEKMSGTIIKDWQLKNNWAPRIGATYDLDRRRQDEAVRQLRASSTRASRTTWRRARSRPTTASRAATTSTPNLTPADSRTAHDAGRRRSHDAALHPRRRGRRHDRSEREAVVLRTSSSLGIEREIMPNTTFGVRYVIRNMPRVLEDVANCPMAAYDLAATSASAAASSTSDQPASATPADPDAIRRPAFASVRSSTIRSTSYDVARSSR